MKKFFLIFAAAAMAAGTMSAQDINQVAETYNNGAMELSMGNKDAALEYFKSALTMAETLGEEGAEIADNCRNNIPVVMLSMAKDLIKADNFDAATQQLNMTVETAELYGNMEIAEEAKTLIGQVSMMKANDLLNAKDFAGAAEAYKQIGRAHV